MRAPTIYGQLSYQYRRHKPKNPVRSHPMRKNGEKTIDQRYPRLLCDRKAVSVAGRNSGAAFRLGAAAITFIFSFLGFLASRLPLCWPFDMSIPLGFEDCANRARGWKTPNQRIYPQVEARRDRILLRALSSDRAHGYDRNCPLPCSVG